MRKTTSILVPMLTAACSLAVGQTAPSADKGKVIYDRWCTPCHGAVAPPENRFGGDGLPGTSALRFKYQGRLPELLEERTDLVPEFIRAVVRGGFFGMPITRKTEISDAELEDIIAYLTTNSD